MICDRQQIPSPGTPAGRGTGVGGALGGARGWHLEGREREQRGDVIWGHCPLRVPTCVVPVLLAPSSNLVPSLRGRQTPRAPFQARRLQELRASSSLCHSPSLPPQAQAAKWGHTRREEAEGGRRAGEEVISPQLAPLPRSLKGRRKPLGLPPWPRLLGSQAPACALPGGHQAHRSALGKHVPSAQDPGWKMPAPSPKHSGPVQVPHVVSQMLWKPQFPHL